MRWVKEKPSRKDVDERAAIASGIFETLKLIPGGAVGRKITEVGEARVRDYWMRMHLHKTGDPRYSLPSKGARRHFWRSAVRPRDALVNFERSSK